MPYIPKKKIPIDKLMDQLLNKLPDPPRTRTNEFYESEYQCQDHCDDFPLCPCGALAGLDFDGF